MRLDLDRYNRILWALIGTLLMAGLLALLIGGLASFWPSRDGNQSLPAGAAASDGSSTRAAVLRLGLPDALKGTDLLLVPVEGLPHEAEEPRGLGSYGKGAPTAPLFNLLFVDARTQASHPLLAQKGLILHHEVLVDRGEAKDERTVGLLIRLVDADTNGNGRLDEEDGARIWLCDASGRNLRAVTQPETACRRWHYDSTHRTVYLVVEPRDGSRGPAPAELLAVPLDASRPARPLVAGDQLEALRGLLQH